MGRFFSSKVLKRPILFEVFTDSKHESNALKILYTLQSTAGSTAKNVVKNMLGEKGVATLKKVIKK